MNWFFFLFLAVIFILSPYYKGLYFSSSFYSISVILSVLFLILMIYLIIKKEGNSLKRILPLLLLPLCYLISLFVAESPKGAIDSLFQWISYVSFFILLYWVTQVKPIERILPIVFQITGAWLAFFTLLAFYGVVHFHGAFVAHRFGSVFQYANTFGMLMAVFGLFSLIILTKRGISKAELVLYSLPLIPFIVCFIQSFSRGMFLVFPIVWFAGLILIGLYKQVEFLFYTLLSFGLSLIIYNYMESGNHNPGLFSLICSMLFFVLIVFFVKYLISNKKTPAWLKKIEATKWSRLYIPVIFFIICLLGGLDFRYQGILYHELPAKLQARIQSVDVGTATAQERLIFIKDGLKMSQGSPIIGFGGEAWAAINKKYQHMPYLSNKAHNGYLEWVIDTGWFGFFLFIGVWIYFYWLLFKRYLEEKENTIQAAVLVSTFGIFLHSFLDFNFSFSTIWLMVMWLFVMGLGALKKVQPKRKFGFSNAVLFVFSIMVVADLFFSFRFMNADQAYTESMQTNSPELKESALERAVSYDPQNVTYRRKLSDLYLMKFKSGVGGDTKDKLDQSIQILSGLEPNNSASLLKAGILSEQANEKENALKYYSMGLSNDHFDKQLYENSIRLKVTMAIDQRKNGNITEESQLINSAIHDYQNEKKWYNYFVTHAPKEAERFNSRNFSVTASSEYSAALAFYLQQNYLEVQTIAESMKANQKEKEKVCALEILALQKEAKQEEAQLLLNKYKNNFPSLLDTMKSIQNLL